MQQRPRLVVFFAACLAMTVSAAPVAEFAIVRVAELPIARAPEPIVQEARACNLYSCIWYAVLTMQSSTRLLTIRSD
ncbi:hypothetical protein DFH07DRAFT_968675 [Mycena maculata]|uniref:Secreted protein n=1 Tax=Mycena maculata TaxID=230809 RepID=A0AAD7I1E3_9AGAR|nr:hypothetical protein DFH07DRAFT_968675 [Mycena maculata]